MKTLLDELATDLERAEALQNILKDVATGGGGNALENYRELRKYFIDSPIYRSLVPKFVITATTVGQIWVFIQPKFSTYAERKRFIDEEFQNLIVYLEGTNKAPADDDISDVLRSFNEEGVHSVWSKALERR